MHCPYSLTRRNLRDVIIALSLISSIFVPTSTMEMCLGFGFLAVGCFLHFASKGILIRASTLCNRGTYGLVRHPYYLANI